MKVLLLSVRSDIGGGPKHVYDLMFHAKSSGIEYYIAAPSDGDFSGKFKDLSFSFFQIPFRKFSLIKFFQLIGFIHKNKIKIVHSHGRGAGLYSRLLKLFGFKVVHTFHGVHIGEGLVGKIKLLMDKILIPLTDKFICVSESERLSAITEGVTSIDKTIVINNGVELYGLRSKARNDKVIVGTLARFNHQKGLDILVGYIYKFVHESDTNFEVHIAGDGEGFLITEQLIKTKELDHVIKLMGPTREPINFLYSLDFYISFARFEGLPIAVLEAMSCGIPCLLSKVVGNIDIVEHEKNGLLFDLDNYESFKVEFEKMLDQEYREKFIQPSLKTIRDKFSVESMCEKTYEVYKTL